MKYNNIGLSNYLVEALNESSQRLRESKNRIAQVSFDVMYDPEDEEHTPEDVVYNVEWEFENTDTFGNCRLLGTGIEDLTDVYRSNYGNEFGELEESIKLNEVSLELDRCPNKVRNFIGEHDQAWEDCCRYFHVDPEDDNALDNIDIYDILDWVYEHDQLYDDLYHHVLPSDEEIEKFFVDNDIPYNERGYFTVNDFIEES